MTSVRRTPRPPRTVLLALLAAFALLGLGIHPATAATGATTPTGSISGTVTFHDSPARYVGVDVYRVAADRSLTFVKSKETDADGRYLVGKLDDGSYRVSFTPQDPDLARSSWRDAPSPALGDDVVVGAGAPVTGIDAALQPGSDVEVKVSFEGGGGDVSNVDASAYLAVTDDAGTTTWQPVPVTEGTDASGHVYFEGLRAGTYRFGFAVADERHVSAFYGGARDLDHATDVVVGTSQTVRGLTVTLPLGGTISGTVTKAGGVPLDDVRVSASVAGGTSEPGDEVSYANTDAKGHYTLPGLDDGDYVLHFEKYNLSLPSEYYKNAYAVADATPVHATVGAATTGINARLDKPGVITGSVALPAGVASTDYASRDVTAVDPTSGEVRGYGRVSHGAYSITAPAGTYRIEFARLGGPAVVAGQYYKGRSETAGPQGATLVTVGVGATRSGIDATLRLGGSITGTLRNAAGKPLSCEVEAFTDDGHLSFRQATSASSTGAFTIKGLSTGGYHLEVNPQGRCRNAAPPAYYDADSPSRTSATAADADEVMTKVGAATRLPGPLTY